MRKTTIKLQYDTVWKLNLKIKELTLKRKRKITQDEFIRELLDKNEIKA
jgi:hypothetical protein